jgi:hypothetical protein
LLLLTAGIVCAATQQYLSAKRKLDSIEHGRAPAGSQVVLTPAELNAWVQAEVPEIVPEGVRNPKVELGNETAVGYAMVDFLKLRHARGTKSGWLMRKLLEGERPVKVSAKIVSANGKATVDVERVEISGQGISGGPLDFLIDNFLLPLYPTAKIGEPFELGHGLERLMVKPHEVRLVMAK